MSSTAQKSRAVAIPASAIEIKLTEKELFKLRLTSIAAIIQYHACQGKIVSQNYHINRYSQVDRATLIITPVS